MRRSATSSSYRTKWTPRRDRAMAAAQGDRPVVDTTGFEVGGLRMVDDRALPQAQSLFAYLRGVAASGRTLFGHQNDATDTVISAQTAREWSGVASDVHGAVGDFPGLHGYNPPQVEEVLDAHRK